MMEKQDEASWAMKHLQWTTDDWEMMRWTDETFDFWTLNCRKKEDPSVRNSCHIQGWKPFSGSSVADLHTMRVTLKQNSSSSFLHYAPSGMRPVSQGAHSLAR
ncbi:hypothetical protein GOODEAATRI_001900 [Goodea atripinnis]|uniref:Uncharacterized protein n=1 Tax=Goodea atripinnis TaxID=208336 RepID=A0ABV0PK02_9TELE